MALAGCSKEMRSVEAEVPQTPPNGPDDLRVARYEGNVYQVSQGGRYFTWYGCGACHGRDAVGVRDLADTAWSHGRRFDEVYGFIALGHSPGDGPYARRIPAEQLWQITAFVRSLPKLKPERRRRQDLDQLGEPQGRAWSGPIT